MQEELTFEEFLIIAGGHTAFQLMWAGVTLGVFDFLHREPHSTKDKIERELSLSAYSMRVLLEGLTALRLIKKEGDKYVNGQIVEHHLVSTADESVVDILGWQANIVYPGEVDFVESLRTSTNIGLRNFSGTGDTLYSRLRSHPDLEEIFHRAMSSLSRTANSMFVKSVDLSNLHHLVDAGGGDGTNAIAIANTFRNLRVTVFDSETVCALAEDSIRRAGMEQRVDTQAGDFFLDPLPPDTDAVLLAHIMTIWSPEQNVALLRRICAQLAPGGRVFIFNMMASDSGDGPLTAALGSPYFLSIATGKGMLYSWSEYERWVLDAGFGRTERVELPRDHGVIVGMK